MASTPSTRLLEIAALCLLLGAVSAPADAEADCNGVAVPYNKEVRFNRTKDLSSPDEYFVPETLDQAIAELDAMLPAEFRTSLTCTSESEMIHYHHGFGTWLRNNWGLWAGGPLAKFFNSLGISHPDDMSGIILTSYHRKLRRVPVELEDQIAGYQAYWESVREAEESAKKGSTAPPPPRDAAAQQGVEPDVE